MYMYVYVYMYVYACVSVYVYVYVYVYIYAYTCSGCCFSLPSINQSTHLHWWSVVVWDADLCLLPTIDGYPTMIDFKKTIPKKKDLEIKPGAINTVHLILFLLSELMTDEG